MGSGCHTTRHNFQQFVPTSLVKLHLPSQVLSSLRIEGKNITSSKMAMILQKKNSQSLKFYFGIFNRNQSIFNLSHGWYPPNHHPGKNSLQNFTLNKCEALE